MVQGVSWTILSRAGTSMGIIWSNTSQSRVTVNRLAPVHRDGVLQYYCDIVLIVCDNNLRFEEDAPLI